MALSVTTGPVHVGQLDLRSPVQPVRVADTFASALLLVTVDGVPAGQVTVPLVDGHASAPTILETVHDELGSDVPAAPPLRSVGRALTVVVATRGRSVSLGRCLRSLLRSDHPGLSVLVVDNDPDDADTAAAVAARRPARQLHPGAAPRHLGGPQPARTRRSSPSHPASTASARTWG